MMTKNQKTIIVGLTVAIIFVLVGVFFLSYALETLDVKAEQLGAQESPIYEPPFPDYSIAGLDSTSGGLIIGIGGTLLLFAIGLAVAKVLNKKKS
jgi:hypothetical protein